MQMKIKARLLVAAMLLAGVSTELHAQSVTQGAITGTVEDTSGALVPNATVEIRNKGTNSTVNLKADSKGYFNAPLLQPGEYVVTITSPAFAKYIADHVLVEVSQTTTVEPRLGAEGTQQVVDVTAATPVINLESPDFSDVIDNHAITEIPENNRRWSSLALLTPGVVSDSNGFGLISVRGISPLLNNVLIDGADDNQAYFAEERGRTREAYSTSEDAVRELTVNTGVYAAEYGRAAGAVINSVTKSGTNSFHGEVYGYDRESNWSAFTPLVVHTTQNAAGAFVTTPFKPKDLRKIFGFAVGGKIISDKLFFYYTFDEHKHIFPGTGSPANAGTFFTTPDANLPTTTAGLQENCDPNTGLVYTGALTTLTSATQVGSNVDNYACALAAREKLGNYAAGALAYTNGLSSLLPELGTVNRIGDQEINTPKLDFQINQKQRLSLLYHRLRWDSPGGVQTQAVVPYGIDTFGNDFVKLDYGLAKLESQITASISNELGYQYSKELDYETQQPLSAYTLNNLTANGNSTYVNLATSSGFNLGSPYYSYRTAYPQERKWQVFDTAYYVKGNHTFKFGIDLLHNYDLINNTFESNGDYNYTYIGNYFADLNRGTTPACNTGASATASVTVKNGVGTINSAVGTSPCYNTFTQGYGSPLFDTATTDYGFFAQDNWKITPRLTLELGVRYDYEKLPQPSSTLTAAATVTSPVTGQTSTFTPYAGITNRPSDKNNVGPRIGFAYDPFGGGTTVLRGGFGVYYGRINNGTILNAYLNTGSPLGQYTTVYKPVTAGHPTLPNLTAGGLPATPSSFFFAPNFQNPLVEQYDLILQNNLTKKVVLNLSYLGALAKELPNFLDLNLNPNTQLDTVTFVGGGPVAAGTQVQVPVFTSYGNTALFGANAANFQAITEIVSNVNASYNAFVAEVKTLNFYGLQVDASYTWSHALDYNQNASTSTSANAFYNPFGSQRANYGNSNYNVPNRFTGYFLYDFPNVGGNHYYKYLTNDWSFNDSFQLQSGLPYSAGLTGTVNGGISSGFNGSGGVAFIPTTVIPGLGRNTFKMKRDITDDIRLVKGIPITERYHLELRGDFFNIANHENVTTAGGTAYAFSSTGTAASNATYQATTFGVPSSINSSGFLYTPREIQLSARFTF